MIIDINLMITDDIKDKPLQINIFASILAESEASFSIVPHPQSNCSHYCWKDRSS